MKVFDDLDTDFDGKVDTFEVLLTIVVWSCASWEEKSELLFRCFDFNRKGNLRFPELAFLVSTTVRATKKFVSLDLGLDNVAKQKAAASEAFDEAGKLELESFRAWFEASDLPRQLREFVDEHSAKGAAPEMKEAPVRRDLRMQDYHAQELSQEVERLRTLAVQLDQQEVERSDQQSSLYEVLSKRIGQLLKKLDCASETLKSELAELTASMNQDAHTSGPAVLLEPTSTLRHDQLRAEIAILQKSCQEDCQESERLLERMKDLTYGTDQALTTIPRPASAAMEEALPPLLGSSASLSMAAHLSDEDRRRRILDRELKRKRAITRIGATTEQPLRAVAKPVVDGDQRMIVPLSTYTAPTAASKASAAIASLAGLAVSAASPALAASSAVDVEQDAATLEAAEAMPIVVAFADFDPPVSHDTQMLTLRIGDRITATGRDGGGWWYGSKADGTEGWFPPSYVQLLEDARLEL